MNNIIPFPGSVSRNDSDLTFVPLEDEGITLQYRERMRHVPDPIEVDGISLSGAGYVGVFSIDEDDDPYNTPIYCHEYKDKNGELYYL